MQSNQTLMDCVEWLDLISRCLLQSKHFGLDVVVDEWQILRIGYVAICHKCSGRLLLSGKFVLEAKGANFIYNTEV